jgi:ectoine hydroxylase-related dioxygenase (phytanoyl-CoA dioxygenase family)
MSLSDQQLNYFNTFGFVVFRQLFSSDEVARYSAEFDRGLDSWLESGKHDGAARHYASLMTETTPFIASIADDPRFGDVAEQLMGKDVLGIAVDGNYYVGDTLWHPDTSSLDYSGIKFTIYLEPQDATNGALRVIPGSHRDPFHSHVSRDVEVTYGVRQDELPAFVFVSTPGDVLAFNVATWHAAFGGSRHRRMGTVVYYEDPDRPEAVTAIQKVMRSNHQLYARNGRQMYTNYWRSVADTRHQRWIGRMAELGILETPRPSVA